MSCIDNLIYFFSIVTITIQMQMQLLTFEMMTPFAHFFLVPVKGF